MNSGMLPSFDAWTFGHNTVIGMLLMHAACQMAVPLQLLRLQKVPSALPAITGESIKVVVYPSTLPLSMHPLLSVLETGTGLQHSVNAYLRPPTPFLPHLLPLDIRGMGTDMMAMGMATDKAKMKMTMAMNTIITTSDLLISKRVLLLYAPQVLTLVRSWGRKAKIMSAWILPLSSNPAEVVYR